MPTQVVAINEFLDSIGTLSGLSRDVAARIMERLKVDNRTGKLDMYLQPLLCGKKSVAWSVRSIQLSCSQRNLLKLMARTPCQKDMAATIIGSREKRLLVDVKRWLEAKGWSVTTNHELLETEDAEVDLLGWNWTYPTELLIVETKAILQADEPNELRSATREMKHAQEQVERIMRLLIELPLGARKAQFPFVDWQKVSQWYGAVMTAEGEPGLEFEHSRIPACSFATLKQRLSPDESRSPSRLWNAMVNRQWQAELRAGHFEYASMELAGVTFEEQVIVY